MLKLCGLKRADVHERSGVKRGFVRWPARGLMRRVRDPLRSVRGAFSFGTFLWASKEKYKRKSTGDLLGTE